MVKFLFAMVIGLLMKKTLSVAGILFIPILFVAIGFYFKTDWLLSVGCVILFFTS